LRDESGPIPLNGANLKAFHHHLTLKAMDTIIDYTKTCGYSSSTTIAAHGQGTRFAMIDKWGRNEYCVYLADLTQQCEDEHDQAYACQKWQSGNVIYTRKELKAAGFNFRKPNPLCLS
jgi:hypothetical protein